MTIGLVLTGYHAGLTFGMIGDRPYLHLAQPLDVPPVPSDHSLSAAEPILDCIIITYRHVQFVWHNTKTNVSTTADYWVPLNEETRKFTEDAEFRQWVLRHLTQHYIATMKDTTK